MYNHMSGPYEQSAKIPHITLELQSLPTHYRTLVQEVVYFFETKLSAQSTSSTCHFHTKTFIV